MPFSAVLALTFLLIAIFIGFMYDVNFGLASIAGAYIVGVMVMGLTPNSVIGMWPTSLFMTLFTITFFFGIGMANGTILNISNRLIYPFRNQPYLIPVVLYFVAMLIAFIGPGSVPCFVLLTPIYMLICKQINCSYAIVPLLVNGASAGAWGPFSLNGVVTRNVLRNAGFAEEAISSLANSVFYGLLMFITLSFILGYFVLKCYKAKKLDMEKPEPMNAQQKKTALLIGLVIGIVVIIPIMNRFITVSWMKTVNGWVSVELLCVTFSVIALLMRIIDFKTALKSVPMNTIVMVCGVSLLIAVAREAGTIKYLAGVISNASVGSISYIIAVFGGIMSFFSSTIGVVMPTCYPIIHDLQAAGIQTGQLLAIVTSASIATGFSPMSTIGGLTMASLPDADDKATYNKIFVALFLISFLELLVVIAMVALGMFSIL